MTKKSARLTMLQLVKTVQDTAHSDEEVVAVLAHLLHTQRVVRSGARAGKKIAAALSS